MSELLIVLMTIAATVAMICLTLLAFAVAAMWIAGWVLRPVSPGARYRVSHVPDARRRLQRRHGTAG